MIKTYFFLLLLKAIKESNRLWLLWIKIWFHFILFGSMSNITVRNEFFQQRNPHGQGMAFSLQKNKFKYLTLRNIQFNKYSIFFEVLFFICWKDFHFILNSQRISLCLVNKQFYFIIPNISLLFHLCDKDIEKNVIQNKFISY